MNFPGDLKYTKTHEWARQDGRQVVVGITEYAQKELSDVVFVELPKEGHQIKQSMAVCVVESVKAAFDIYAPVSGRVVKVNKQLETDPGLVNRDSYGGGWFFAVEPSDIHEMDQLMDAAQYERELKQDVK